jgi:NADH-quinone oxidoreductase subunit C
VRVIESRIKAEEWLATCSAAKSAGATMFDFLTAVDMPDEGEFEIIVHLVDITAQTRHQVAARIPREQPAIGSLVGLFAGAAWHERETHEMFGVDFSGNEDLRPLLTEGGRAWPLRRTSDLKAHADPAARS